MPSEFCSVFSQSSVLLLSNLCVIMWEACIKHFCWIMMCYDSYCERSAWALVSTAIWISCCFLRNATLTWKSDWQTNHGYLDVGICQAFSQKWACHFKESNWQYLSPRITFKFWARESILHTGLLTFYNYPNWRPENCFQLSESSHMVFSIWDNSLVWLCVCVCVCVCVHVIKELFPVKSDFSAKIYTFKNVT